MLTERIRAVLISSHLLGLATGAHLRRLRGMHDPLAALEARLELAELRARLAWESIEILSARFAKIPERNRPYYTPAQRFRILEIRNLLAWSGRQTAKAFLVCTNTILNWERSADPDARTVGATVMPVPPVRRAADAVRALVQTMTALGCGGQDMMARVLARAGWKVSARSIGRYRKERAVAPPPAPIGPVPRRPLRPVVARFVHHVWMMDVSEVKQFLGPTLHMAAVFDAFSRVPLALQVFDTKPGAQQMARLLGRAATAFARPRYLITDLGREFVGRACREAAARLGAVQRFACKDSIKATSQGGSPRPLRLCWRSRLPCQIPRATADGGKRLLQVSQPLGGDFHLPVLSWLTDNEVESSAIRGTGDDDSLRYAVRWLNLEL